MDEKVKVVGPGDRSVETKRRLSLLRKSKAGERVVS